MQTDDNTQNSNEENVVDAGEVLEAIYEAEPTNEELLKEDNDVLVSDSNTELSNTFNASDTKINPLDQRNGDGQSMIDDLNSGTSANYGGDSDEKDNSDNPLTNYTTGGVQNSAGPGFGGNTGATVVDLDKKVDEMLDKQENNNSKEDSNFY